MTKLISDAQAAGCAFLSDEGGGDRCPEPVVGVMFEDGNPTPVEVCALHLTRWHAGSERADWTVGEDRPSVDFRAFPAGEGESLVHGFDVVLQALHRLHAGTWLLDGSRDERTLSELAAALAVVVTHLGPRLAGLRDALIRAHRHAGGSYRELATAIDTSRTTAQTRAVRVHSREELTGFEEWASGPPPEQVCAEEVRPGDTFIESDGMRWSPVQVTDVVIWPPGTANNYGAKIGVATGGILIQPREHVTVIRRNNPDAWIEYTETQAGETLTVYRGRRPHSHETVNRKEGVSRGS